MGRARFFPIPHARGLPRVRLAAESSHTVIDVFPYGFWRITPMAEPPSEVADAIRFGWHFWGVLYGWAVRHEL
jgi:hypothetical protein